MRFWHSSACKAALAASVALAFAGCGDKDGGASFEAARAAFEARDYGKAAKLYDKGLARAPDDVDALVMLARARLALGEIAAAEAAVRRAAERAPGDVDVRLLGAQTAWHRKDLARAAKLFRSVADDASLDASLRAQGWSGLGLVEMTQNQLHLARAAFFRAVRLDRRQASAWYHLGLLYRDGFHYLEAALDQFDIYVRLDKMASPRVQKVQQRLIPELKESIQCARMERPGVARRNGTMAAASISKAEEALRKGGAKALKTAMRHYEEALKADPISYPAALGLAQTQQKADGSAAAQRRALDHYKLACALRPSAISTHLAAGELALKLGHPAVAAEVYSRAVAANPTSVPALDGLVRALRRSGEKEDVLKAYQGYRDMLAKGAAASRK